jgi:hypothetical protein
VTQVIECLLSKHEALSSNPSTERKKQQQKKLPSKKSLLSCGSFGIHLNSILLALLDNNFCVYITMNK